jgi:hypothetical protein
VAVVPEVAVETRFQKLMVLLHPEAVRVRATSLFVVQVVLTTTLYCVTVWLPDCHDPEGV